MTTATGLEPGHIRELRRPERILLAGWQELKSGDDNGRPWLPGAIRRMPVDARLALAGDAELDAAWTERERRRVAGDVGYFVQGYGHVVGKGGIALPFELWPRIPDAARKAIGARDQSELLDLIELEDRLAILKARQLGITWLALHYGYHLMAFDPLTPSATVLGLSQDGGYASRLLERCREINRHLPGFLRHPESRETRDSKTELRLVGRGRMISLQGTPAAPRTHQADFAIADEWAFVRNGQAGPTMTALMPAARKIVAISSGNGPPEEPGWGQSFARLWSNAAEGQSEWRAVFLPTSTHPERTKSWRESEIDNFDSEEEYLAENPEEPDEALIGAGKNRYFKLHDLNAAVALGAELDEQLGTDDMPPPAGEQIHGGLDWGEASHGLVVWPLERGGVYVPPVEVVEHGTEPAETAEHFHDRVLEEIQEVDPRSGQLTPPIGEARYDAAGIQSMRTFLAVARQRYSRQYAGGEVRSRKVPFGDRARGSPRHYKAETALYLRRLARRAGQGRSTQVLAISPSNGTLIRQLRALESGADGVWIKAEDQHGPDALVAAAQRIARTHREMQDEKGG